MDFNIKINYLIKIKNEYE
ncbi:hypothetical protein c7_R225 [Megavirus courdo7]|uniref:Uncharacterized protein n=1 Tax=Megavirus courdo7 TaxID=1128135 RepID=H2EA68_9VIRU|nr:hypothetical protein c7_R225 [Megavirus courdo7]